MAQLFEIIKASEIANNTSNAFMYNMYGKAQWIECIAFLLSKGFNPVQIERIVRSKHMRWSAEDNDNFAEDFEQYYLKNKNGIKSDVN